MSNRKLQSVPLVVAALGGKHAVADMTGRTWSAVWNWESREAFPPNTYTVLKRALEAKGLTAPDALWGMSERIAS